MGVDKSTSAIPDLEELGRGRVATTKLTEGPERVSAPEVITLDRTQIAVP